MALPLSILIPARDRPAALARCLESIFWQDCIPSEILVLDDGSAPPLAETGAVPPHPRLRLLRSETPLGPAAARNFLMHEAHNEVFVFLDDDALLPDPTSLQRIAAIFEETPRAGILAFQIVNHVGEKTRLATPISRFSKKRSTPEKGRLERVSFFIACGCAMRRAATEACGFFSGMLVYGHEELDLSYRMLEAGFDILYDPEIVADHHPVAAPAETTAQKVYYLTRNRLLIAYEHLPVRYLPTHFGVWLTWGAWQAFRHGHLRPFWRGVWGALAQMRHCKRRQVSPRTIAYLSEHAGRLWF